MNLSNFANNVLKTLKLNSPEIFTAIGVSGVVTTAYLAGKASIKASDIIRESEATAGTHSDSKKRTIERTKLVWKCYVPTGVSGALTIGCIIAASKGHRGRTAAAVTAYSLTERAFSEYKEKVVEQIGKTKEQAIRDEIAQDKVNRNPIGPREILVVGSGGVLCCELYTGRYFRSDMETLRKAQNDINRMIMNDPYVQLDEFYELVGLGYTQISHKMGWDSDKLMDLEFSAVLSDKAEPCLAFEYNYLKPL